MAYYKVCPYCGSNLDPGEVCTCKEGKSQDILNEYNKKDSGTQPVPSIGKEKIAHGSRVRYAGFFGK